MAIIDCSRYSLALALAFASGLRSERGPIGVILVEGSWTTPSELDALYHANCHYLSAGAEVIRLEECLKTIASGLAPKPQTCGTLRWGPLRVNLIGGFAEVGAEFIDLQPLQLRILGFLVANAGRHVSHDELRRSVFRASQASDSTSIARQISILRNRLGPLRAMLRTVPGGYAIQLAPTETAVSDNLLARTRAGASPPCSCDSLQVVRRVWRRDPIEMSARAQLVIE